MYGFFTFHNSRCPSITFEEVRTQNLWLRLFPNLSIRYLSELYLQSLLSFIERFPLTPSEKSVLSRGRNANLSARKKMKGMMGKNGGAGAADFQDSTAFEALLGYTFISNKQRFVEMIDAIRTELDEMDNI